MTASFQPGALQPDAFTASPGSLRALVVEDSLTIRKYLVGVLQSHGIEVVGEAENGVRAFELCQSLRPDVVTMDMILPELSGLAATEQIMAFCPTPILIVSASVNRGEVFQTYDALAAGAVDVFDKVRTGPAKPTQNAAQHDEPTQKQWEERFVAAVRMAARIKVITHPRARLQPARAFLRPPGTVDLAAKASRAYQAEAPSERAELIALGASTGGPAAIVEILRGLPADFAVPILIVLHISELFSFAFAEWLNTLSPIPARYARDGEPVPLPGKPQIILAPAGRHLVVEGNALRLRDTPERHSCKPSIDVLFESLAAQPARHSLLCLLTGMGRDGATGLLAARQAGLQTIAQDEATSIIFGMPGEAVRLGAAERVLPLYEIAPLLLQAAVPQAATTRQKAAS